MSPHSVLLCCVPIWVGCPSLCHLTLSSCVCCCLGWGCPSLCHLTLSSCVCCCLGWGCPSLCHLTLSSCACSHLGGGVLVCVTSPCPVYCHHYFSRRSAVLRYQPDVCIVRFLVGLSLFDLWLSSDGRGSPAVDVQFTCC